MPEELSLETIDPELRKRAKLNRLLNLQSQWMELYMSKVAMEASGNTTGAASVIKSMEEVQRSYDAIFAIVV